MQTILTILAVISIPLALTEGKIIYDLVQDYNILLGSYKQMGQVMVAEGVLKQEEYDRFIKNKKEKGV